MRNHYADPTANTAIAHVIKELKMQKKLEEQERQEREIQGAAENEEKIKEDRIREEELKLRKEALLRVVWPIRTSQRDA